MTGVDYRDFYRGRRVHDHRRPGLHRQQPRAPARRARRRRPDRRLAQSRLRRQPASTSTASRTASASTSPTCATQSDDGHLVQDREVIFNLAGQVSHIDSMRDPYTDLEINCRAQLSMLEACRRHNPGVQVVYAGTRQVYGRPDRLPVDEQHLVRPDRHQRRQQGGRRVLPPALQQRVRRPRLLAAADQRLRPAAADQAQPPGLHRLVHPAGHRGRRDPDLRRRLAAARLRLRRRRRRRVPARRRDATRATARCSTSAATSRSAIATWWRCCSRPPARAASASSSGRRRRSAIDIGSFYSDSTKFRQTVGWAAARRAARGPARGRSPSTASTCAHYVDPPRPPRSRPVIPFLQLTPGDDAAAVRGGDRRAWSSAAGSCSGPSSTRSSGVRRGLRRAARGRRRHRHRRARRSRCARSASAPATKSSPRRCRRPTRRWRS